MYADVYVHTNLSTQKSYLHTLNVYICVRTINTYNFENLNVDISISVYILHGCIHRNIYIYTVFMSEFAAMYVPVYVCR